MSSSNLNKKRLRPSDSITITIGKKSHSYYYISDSLSGGNNKIKISMVDLSNTKEENHISIKEHEEDNDNSSDIINLNHQTLKEELPKIVNNIKNNETEQIFLPISVSWFCFDNIHEIEMKSLPEFFCGKYPSKTPKLYKNYRNFIVNLYRENSSMYLSSNTCRKHLAGDACAILRIHSFLEHWGLINFKFNIKFKPNFIPKTSNIKSPIYIDTNLFIFENNNNVKNNNLDNNTDSESDIVLYNQKRNIATALYPITKMSNKLFNDFLVDTSNEGGVTKNLEQKKFNKINFLSQNYRPKCDLCGNLCTMDWFTTKDKNTEEESESDNDINISIKIDEKSMNKDFYLICEECFSKDDVSLPGDLKKENFEVSSIYNLFSKEKFNEKIIDKLNKEKWTEKEDQKLLEGIKNNKSWEEVVKSLGSETKKTKKDCILHILQIPMKKMDEKNNNDNSESLDEKESYDNEKEDEDKSNIDEVKNSSENDTNVNHEVAYKNSVSGDINDLDDKTDILDDEEKRNENIFNRRKNEDINNIYMIEIFMRLLKRYLNEKIDNENSSEDKNENVTNKSFKDIIYRTFAKSISKCKELKKEEKNEIKSIVDILVYLQMKKIELKMSYFKQFERVLEYKKTQLRAIETEIMQERIKLITKKFLLQQRQQQQTNENN